MRKFDLSLRSSRSSYSATFRHQLTLQSHTDALDEEKRLAGLYRYRIGAERDGRLRKLDAKFCQPLIGTGRVRMFLGFYLPMCATPGTCNTSPVMWVASVW